MAAGEIEHLVLFGATGDLAARMLIPSLWFLDADGLLSPRLKVVGLARAKLDRDAFLEKVRATLAKRVGSLDEAVWKRFAARSAYCSADDTTAEGLEPLAKILDGSSTVYYLALSPSLYGRVCAALA
ncbi:MAG: glucose-6-phosphate dehydrogenase, partial [Caulobacteraceae bacterium]